MNESTNPNEVTPPLPPKQKQVIEPTSQVAPAQINTPGVTAQPTQTTGPVSTAEQPKLAFDASAVYPTAERSASPSQSPQPLNIPSANSTGFVYAFPFEIGMLVLGGLIVSGYDIYRFISSGLHGIIGGSDIGIAYITALLIPAIAVFVATAKTMTGSYMSLSFLTVTSMVYIVQAVLSLYVYFRSDTIGAAISSTEFIVRSIGAILIIVAAHLLLKNQRQRFH